MLALDWSNISLLIALIGEGEKPEFVLVNDVARRAAANFVLCRRRLAKQQWGRRSTTDLKRCTIEIYYSIINSCFFSC